MGPAALQGDLHGRRQWQHLLLATQGLLQRQPAVVHRHRKGKRPATNERQAHPSCRYQPHEDEHEAAPEHSGPWQTARQRRGRGSWDCSAAGRRRGAQEPAAGQLLLGVAGLLVALAHHSCTAVRDGRQRRRPRPRGRRRLIGSRCRPQERRGLLGELADAALEDVQVRNPRGALRGLPDDVPRVAAVVVLHGSAAVRVPLEPQPGRWLRRSRRFAGVSGRSLHFLIRLQLAGELEHCRVEPKTHSLELSLTVHVLTEQRGRLLCLPTEQILVDLPLQVPTTRDEQAAQAGRQLLTFALHLVDRGEVTRWCLLQVRAAALQAPVALVLLLLREPPEDVQEEHRPEPPGQRGVVI
mmetsp:Transcript_79908/g.247987  ORF Transcript_79908/g.247987 Transcript_79908/m.247987 type:complete len:354 (-) Transcript_79908:661-1722(-)